MAIVRYGNGDVGNGFGGEIAEDFVQIKGIMRKVTYLLILQKHPILSCCYIMEQHFVLQQDNDPKHYTYCIKVKVKLATLVEGDPKAPFSVGEDATPFRRLLYFTLDPDRILLNVKQGGIKYHFLSLWYDSTWAIGEHSWLVPPPKVSDFSPVELIWDEIGC